MKIKDLTLIGMFASFMFVATWIHIPINLGYASMIHLGTAALLISSVFLTPKQSFFAAAIGMSLFDLLDPTFIIWAPFTFIIKGSMAFVVSWWIHNHSAKIQNKIIAFAIGSLISVAGYYLAGSILLMDFRTPLTHIPSSLITSSIGILITLPIVTLLEKTKIKSFA